MTNREVILILKALKRYYNNEDEYHNHIGFDDDDNKAIDMAIAALMEQVQDETNYIRKSSVFDHINDNLETARIYAGAEFDRLYNNKQYLDACIFQSIITDIIHNEDLLDSYRCATEREDKE